MALSKSTISVPLGSLDTKTSEKLVANGLFLSLVNTVRRKTGELAKRFGFMSLVRAVTDESEIDSGKRLEVFKNDLALIDGESVFSYSPAAEKWINRGSVVPTVVDSYPVVRNTSVQRMADGDYLDGFEVYAWEDSRGGIRCSIVDAESGAFLLSDQEVSSTGVRPKVLALSTVVLITYIEGSNFKCRRVTIGEPSTLQTAQTVEAGIADYPYDIAKFNDVVVFIYNKSSVLRVGYILPSGVVSTAATGGFASPVDFTVAGKKAVTVVPDEINSIIYFFYYDTAGAEANLVRVAAYTSDLITSSVGTIESIATACNITGVIDENGTANVFYEITAVASYNHRVRSSTCVYSADTLTLGTPAAFKRSVGLATKAFLVQDLIYVGLVFESALQSTYFVADDSGLIVARMQASRAAGLTRDTAGVLKPGLAKVAVISETEFSAPFSVINRLTTLDSTKASAFVGVNQQRLTFNSSEFDTDTLGENLHIAGGVLVDYDGTQVVEHGFNVYPEGVAATPSTSGGSLGTGNFYLRVLYEWVDSGGQIHRSAPSISLLANIASGSTGSISVAVPSLRLTGKSYVKVVVYRTTVGGTTIYYRDNEIANDATADTVTISLTQADTALDDNEILYTVGGTLDNIAPPSCKVAHKHKNRLFLAGLEEDDIWYSKEFVQGEGVAFNDGQKLRCDPFGGRAAALSSLDDKLVIFKPRALFTLVGDGPVDTGAQNDFTQPQLLSSDVGCENQKSIAIMPLGVMFQSQKGIWLVDRGLNLKYIGSPVEAFNSETVTSAVVIDSTNEVRFTTEAGNCLVYNYVYEEWSTFSNYEANGAVNWQGSYCHLKADGTVNQEVQNQYNDNGQTIRRRIETAWLRFAALQGFQRLYRWALLGDFLSHHVCRTKIAYDYEDIYTETVYFNTETGLGTEVYGDGDYGEAVVYGGSNSRVFQFRSKPGRQKCQSFKLLIEDLDTLTDNGGGCFNLVAMSFDIGQKQGLNRMGSLKSRGS